MCGIFGIVTRATPISPAILEDATRSLAHRGPDDSGTVLLNENQPEPIQIGLGHRRLAILDLSPLGHQPMQDPVTGNWIVFNGEIYNFRELQKELETAGVTFKSQCDTEVILAAYRVWGESCLTLLGGMFAFALWDATKKRLLLARDPLGIKPLYFHQSKQTFVFASEVRTILQTGFVEKKADPAGVLSFLEFGSVYEPWTIVEGVKAVSSREYWNPLRSALTSETAATIEDRLPTLLRESVLSHLVSDVPVGVFLSGGIDSSALVAVLSQNGVQANTFSLVFQEEEFNEAQYSQLIARTFGTKHQEISISQQDTLAALPDALCAMDQPTIDGINTYLVSAKTRASGVKVALTGLGADEMFAGYSNFRRVPRMESFTKRFSRLPRLARRPLAAAMAFFAGRDDRGRKLAELAKGLDEGVHAYFLSRMLFGALERQALFLPSNAQASQQSLDQMLQHSIAASDSLDPINRVSYLESHFYMRNTLLRDSDFMSMAHGLELRVPFLDRQLVEACFRIPGSKKLEGISPKSLLLASLGVELPKQIVNRPKRGFTLPFERWLRGEMKPVVENTLLNSNWDQTSLSAAAVREVWRRFLAGETSWSRPWSLFVLKRWCERNF
jgi:asparagine synthase (glutamine-hydrolysing)